MSGVHGGVQKLIRDQNPLARFIPCSNHSLNLAGSHACSTTVGAVTFFGTVQRVFTSFSGSTGRWAALEAQINIDGQGLKPKRLIDTRWNAHYKAVRALRTRLVNILDVLDDMGKDQTFSLDTRSEAISLSTAIYSFSFFAHLHYWEPILREINIVQKAFQQRGLGLDSTKVRVVGLERFLNESREDFANEAVREAESLCEKMGVTIEKRIPRRKMMPGEKAKDAGLTPKEEIRRQLLSSHDRLCQELSSRFDAIKSTCDIFRLIDILFTKKTTLERR